MSPETATLLLKLTAWSAVPFLVKPLLARLSASTRHLLLTLTLTGTLIMPVLLVTAPSWNAPAWLSPPALTTPTSGKPPAERPWVAERPDIVVETRVEFTGPREAVAPSPGPTPKATAVVPLSASPPPRSGPSWPSASWLGWLWVAGTVVMALRLAAAVLHAGRVVRDAEPIDEPRANEAMAAARARLRTGIRPELLQSHRSRVPFAWRGLSPAVVLPDGWRFWEDERLNVVLVHELAHLNRRDALALWIGRTAAALWWFHPLVRKLEGWARRECEQAADDAVLLSGSRASEYAEHLIAISRALSPRRGATDMSRPFPSGVTMMMSNSPDLKHRLLAILNADRPRRALSRRLTAGTSLAALAFAMLLAGARFAPVALAQDPDPDVDPQVDVRHDGPDQGDYDFDFDFDSDSDSDSESDDSESDSESDDSESDSESDSDSEVWAGRGAWKTAYKAHRKGRWDEAIASFEAAAEAGYRPAVATYNAACGLSMSGRSDEALATLRRALDLGLDDPELLAEDSDLDPLRSDDRFQELLDEAFQQAGERRHPIEHHRYRHAQETLDVLRETVSENAGAWSKVGTRLLTLRRLDDAAEALENAARYAREAPSTTLYNLACAYALNDRPRLALDALERSIEAGYSDPDHMRRDPDLASLRDDAEFERLVTLAEDLDLDQFQHHWWNSRVEDRHDRRYSPRMWAPAIDHFRALVDRRPDLGAGWFNLGYALHYSERWDEAIEAFAHARDLGYRPSTATYNIACGHSMLNRVEDALVALEDAVELGFKGGSLDHDSDLDNLREDPRFRSLLLKMRLDRHG